MAEAPPALALVPGFEVRAVERIYRGLCAACAAASDGEARTRRAARA